MELCSTPRALNQNGSTKGQFSERCGADSRDCQLMRLPCARRRVAKDIEAVKYTVGATCVCVCVSLYDVKQLTGDRCVKSYQI